MIKWASDMKITQSIYTTIYVIAFICDILFYYWYGKKHRVSGIKSVILLAWAYPLTLGWIYIQYWIASGFQSFGGKNLVRGMIYIPLIAYPLARKIKFSWSLESDLLAPAPCVAQGISHFGCMFTGCCCGYPWKYGIYNETYCDYRFPIQLVEALTSLIIVAVLVLREKRHGYRPDGYAYPLMSVMFGSTRFLYEFWRDNEKVMFGCSTLSFHALLMAVVGLIWIIILKVKEHRIPIQENTVSTGQKRKANVR